MSGQARRRQLDDLFLQLKGLVLVRALLEERGASQEEAAAHTQEIARVRSQFALTVRDYSATLQREAA